MTEPEESLPLAADFPAATRQAWRKLVDAALKGKPLAGLRSTTYDGLVIEPLAVPRLDARPIAARPGATAWQVMARIEHPDPALANAAARDELENGANGLALVFAGAVGDYGFGLPPTEEALGRALEDIDVGGGIAVELDLSAHAEAAIDAALSRGLALPRRLIRLRIGHDPLGAMAVAGGAARRWSEAAPHFARRLAALARAGFEQKLVAADGRVVHNAGGSEAQELAFVLGTALCYLRALAAEGVALEDARRMIFFRLAADADQLLSIAKFRAMRKLWARVEQSCGLTPEPAFIAAETAWRMMTRRDPHVNILRTTIAVFAAALGGADAIAVLPFTAALGLPDGFARRIARNMQLILLEESHLGMVADPAAGSGAIEDLTDRLCGAAWALFQLIETAGGAAAALEGGLIQRKVESVRALRKAAVARLEDPLTGVSIYPAIGEARATVLAETPPRSFPPQWARENSCEALSPMRLARPFEQLRDASDRHRAAHGARPKVFLVDLEPRADNTARAGFAMNFFEAGGIEAVKGPAEGASLAEAFKNSGATLACICGSDTIDAGDVATAAKALQAAGARHVYFAGRPSANEMAYRAAGVGTFIDAGSDVLAVLEAAHRLIAA